MAEIRELTPADAPELAALYTDYEWWADREDAAVREALAATELAIGVVEDERLVAAARVLTDYVYYGKVYDVIVAADRRSEGIGEQLLRAVVDHPDLQSLPGLYLECRAGLVPFYRELGFERDGRRVDVPEGGREELVRMKLRFEAGP